MVINLGKEEIQNILCEYFEFKFSKKMVTATLYADQYIGQTQQPEIYCNVTVNKINGVFGKKPKYASEIRDQIHSESIHENSAK